MVIGHPYFNVSYLKVLAVLVGGLRCPQALALRHLRSDLSGRALQQDLIQDRFPLESPFSSPKDKPWLQKDLMRLPLKKRS